MPKIEGEISKEGYKKVKFIIESIEGPFNAKRITYRSLGRVPRYLYQSDAKVISDFLSASRSLRVGTEFYIFFDENDDIKNIELAEEKQEK